jgi:hypothetical protein
MLNQKLIKVKDNPGLARDSYSGAILDVNRDEYNKYLSMKNQRLQQKEQLQSMESRINNMEDTLCSIQSMLQRLLEDKNGHNI